MTIKNESKSSRKMEFLPKSFCICGNPCKKEKQARIQLQGEHFSEVKPGLLAKAE